MHTALTIAGSDPCSSTGVQADIRVMTMNGVYPTSVITSLTAMNTSRLYSFQEMTSEIIGAQLDAIFTDIRPDAVKIGWVSSSAVIATIAGKLRQYHAKNIVLDPVMIASDGQKLLENGAANTMRNELLPLATVVTPNCAEAAMLTGFDVRNEYDMIRAAERLCCTYPCACILKGGHSQKDDASEFTGDDTEPDIVRRLSAEGTSENSNDLLYMNGSFRWFRGRRIKNQNTRGTGSVFSSALTANLAKGFPLTEAVSRAKEYVTDAIASGLDLGSGRGPVNAGFPADGYYTEEPDNADHRDSQNKSDGFSFSEAGLLSGGVR